MDLELRVARPDDASTLGRIDYETFKAIADQHNFQLDLPISGGCNHGGIVAVV